MPAIFITGTGTDIGKTVVTAGLVRHWRNVGRPVDALKPLVTGFDPATLATSDPGVLLSALRKPTTMAEVERIAPFRFAGAFAPDLAARREGRSVDYQSLIVFCTRAAQAPHMVLIEGVGGAMVPLDDRHTVLDWMSDLECPVVLVAGSYLGSISHTLTCIDSIRRRGVAIKAVVVNETAHSTVGVADTIVSLGHFIERIPIIALARLTGGKDDDPAFAEIGALL